MTIKIRVRNEEVEFESSAEMLAFLFDLQSNYDRDIPFQKLTYADDGSLEEMEYLTFSKGRLRETHNTRY